LLLAFNSFNEKFGNYTSQFLQKNNLLDTLIRSSNYCEHYNTKIKMTDKNSSNINLNLHFHLEGSENIGEVIQNIMHTINIKGAAVETTNTVSRSRSSYKRGAYKKRKRESEDKENEIPELEGEALLNVFGDSPYADI
jgi:hypothetical protein